MIDDLTIENKRLRQLLQERRQQHDPKLDRDKIFEVRTCNLSPEKKLELKAILQKFAATIQCETTAQSQMQGEASALSAPPYAMPGQIAQRPPSYTRTDSAYASMSNSGLTSNGQSNKGRIETQRTQGNNNSNVRSYLHDIPDSLLPKHSPIMSEQSKMRLVVRRLEQLFTGKNAAPGEHSQPLQQQKLSESAASADRHNSKIFNKYLRPEGAREAHILPFGSKISLDLPNMDSSQKQLPEPKPESERSSDSKSTSSNRSPEQRPTRPLDLDIHRAQIAEENIEYIRHLGLPTPTHERDPDNPDDGWVYLNLLINMAQLHTINVTPAFVRKAITSLSTQLELSKDTRKIRWKGGCEGTASLGDSDSAVEVARGGSPELVSGSNTSKHLESTGSDKLASTGSSEAVANRPPNNFPSGGHSLEKSTSREERPPTEMDRPKEESAFDYKPIFFRNTIAVQDDNLCDDSDRLTSAQAYDDLTGHGSSTDAKGITGSNSPRSEEDGAIIYYRNPSFYCDMSGDKQSCKGSLMTPTTSKSVLGVPIAAVPSEQEQKSHGWTCFEGDTKDLVDDEYLPAFEPIPLSDIADPPSNSIDLEASGIGGVFPDDHFILQVQRKRQRSFKTPPGVSYPAQTTNSEFKPIIEEEIISTTRVDLPPAKLPSPSYVFLPFSSDDSSDFASEQYFSGGSDDSEDDLEDGEESISPALLTRFPTLSSGQRHAKNEDSPEMKSQPFMETLDAPKAADPDTEAEQGSEFDRTRVLGQSLGILTGSLAATVGAGSAASMASNRSASSNKVF